MNSSAIFHLRLFGTPSVTAADGTPVTGRAVQRHRIALLGLLATAPPQGLSRDRALAYLWPESEPDHARQLLNQAVYNLRKGLGEGALASAADDLRLNPELLRVDVAEFEAAVAQGDQESAVALYSGPFLDGFFLTDAREFESWLDRERERLAGLYARALEALAEAAERRSEFPIAVEWWKARAGHDPFDSRTAMRLMQALDASGNRAAALQHAAIHERMLKEEFGVGAAAEVVALAERMRSRPVATIEPSRAPGEVADELAGTDQETAIHLTTNRSVPSEPATTLAPARPRRRAAWYGVAALVLGIVVVTSLRWGSGPRDTPLPADDPSIAVLPLANLSTDPRDAALADGMTEELIAVLAKTSGLRVIASTSVFSFRDRKLDVRTIADSLHVRHLLEGALQKSGSRLRVQVRLVDAADGSTRWSETYDRELRDVFAVQDEIARAVSRELGLRLRGGTHSDPRRQHTQNIAAYELYLRGNDPALLRSDSGALEALKYFQQAVALDSTYAAAYAGLARMYRVVNNPRVAPGDLADLAEHAAMKAVTLDDSVAEAQASLGLVRLNAFDLASAATHLKRAIELDQTRAQYREWLARAHILAGRPEDALTETRRALETDPLSPSAHAEFARALIANDRCDEALAELEKIAAVQPPLRRVKVYVSLCHVRRGMWQEVIAAHRRGVEQGEPTALGIVGYALARAGRREEALRLHATLLEHRRHRNGRAFELALSSVGLGDLDQAFAWLEEAIDERSLNTLLGEPLFDELRADPRFARLLERGARQKR